MQIEQLNVLAKERGQTLAEMALAWVLKDGVVTSVLIGASKPSQILDNIRVVQNTSFCKEELEKIEEEEKEIFSAEFKEEISKLMPFSPVFINEIV